MKLMNETAAEETQRKEETGDPKILLHSLPIRGLQKLTLLDFPGKLAATLFLGGCNFRCPFCQNSALVLGEDSPGKNDLKKNDPGKDTKDTQKAPSGSLSMEEFLSFLKKRSGLLDGVCVSGGEPTLHPALPLLLGQIKEQGYLVKLDTNGTNPNLLSELIAEHLVDYIAMDIKAGRPNYARVCGLNGWRDRPADPLLPSLHKKQANSGPADFSTHRKTLLARVIASADLLMSGSVDYEFRTTVVRGLHTEEDFLDIRSWLRGCRRYILQSFRDSPQVLASKTGGSAFPPSALSSSAASLPAFSLSAFSKEEMQTFLNCVRETIPHAALREDADDIV